MYSQPITHLRRTAFVIMVDCSTSMNDMATLNTMTMRRTDAVATVCNFMLDELLERATRGQEVRNYYDVAVLGYSNNGVRSLLSDDEEWLIPITRMARIAPEPETRCFEQLLDDSSTTSAFFTLRPWIKPVAEGNTPMHMALTHVYMLLDKWCSRVENRNSFPPMVFNITDGFASDATPGELISIARCITGTKTEDGNTLLINIKLSNKFDERSELFPSADSNIAGSNNNMTLYQTLCQMSSVMPKQFEPYLSTIINHNNPGPYRGLALNASPCELLSILNIGSESINVI